MHHVTFDNLHYRYPGATTDSLKGVSLDFPDGQRIALLGRNGSGKSTLMLHGNGILRPKQGAVRLNGEAVDYSRASLKLLRRHVGIVFQNADDQLFSASVAQDISFGPLNLGLDESEVRDRVKMAAELCEITALLERPTHALSGGEKTRVALAGILAMDPNVILADEVTSNLDPWMRRQVLCIFQRLAKRGKTIVLATHDLELAQRWADRFIVMDAGSIIADGTQDVLTNSVVRTCLALDNQMECDESDLS